MSRDRPSQLAPDSFRASGDRVSRPAIPFAETEYGIVKRLVVVERWMRRIEESLGQSPLSVLDYGCGTGDHLTYPLALTGHDVLGVDIHELSIVEGRRRYALPNLAFRSGTVDDLLAEGLTFDAAICSEVLEHLHDPRDFLVKLRRLVRAGGAAIITTPNGYGSFEMLRRLEAILNRVGVHQALRRFVAAGRALGRRVRGSEASPCSGFLDYHSVHVQFFRLKRLESLFRQSGFQVVERRARTLLCGPYIDVAFRLVPWRQPIFRLNNRLADLLPFAWAADWMFLLEQTGDVRG